jgi:predicted nuclease of restriction endonuclease-like (RecB) superfamily
MKKGRESNSVKDEKRMAVLKLPDSYMHFESEIVALLEAARSQSGRAVNSIITSTYWEVGRRIVVFEQVNKVRANYGEALLLRLSAALTTKFGRGFAKSNLYQMRAFYSTYSEYSDIFQTLSGKSMTGKFQTASGKSQAISAEFTYKELSQVFPLSWSHYVLLLSAKLEVARKFYETEALRGGWSVRQLERQMDSQFFERVALSRNKAAVLAKGNVPRAEDIVTPEEEIKSPYFLEFLGLKDEYSESQLEEALIHHLESFLLELGFNFTFVARQKRLRLDDEWYRVDLVFYHRKLRCLVLIDLKLGKFTHADAGQMHMYLNYAKEHWTLPDENPPVGLILCAKKTENVVKYALDNLPNKVMAAEYLTALPKEKLLLQELEKTQKMIGRQSKEHK